MELQYLGTAAAEGIPALLCTCEACVRSRKIGGRALRTRSQAIVNGELLIDFPADTYSHILQNGLDLCGIRHCLITHSHSDHLYPTDITMLAPGFSHAPDGYCLHFYATEKAGETVQRGINASVQSAGLAEFHAVEPFVPFTAGRYTITALPAIHDPGAGPVIYSITDGEKTMLYAHDTHYFRDDVWSWFAETNPKYDLISLDCTNACLPLTYVGHMGLEENAAVRKRMMEGGWADEHTKFVCNHFSHNGIHVVYDDFVPLAAEQGFLVSYDGMKISF